MHLILKRKREKAKRLLLKLEHVKLNCKSRPYNNNQKGGHREGGLRGVGAHKNISMR